MSSIYSLRANARNDENLNEIQKKVFRNIKNKAKRRESDSSIVGLFDDIDLNSNKLGPSLQKRNERLTKLIDLN